MSKQTIADLISINLISGSKIPALKHREVEYALLDAIFSVGFITGDIKEVDCTNQYIIDNFEANGLGKNERTGWAICNGNNGTTNRNGRVSMPYGSSYLTMRFLGGASTHTLSLSEIPSHSHGLNVVRLNESAPAGSEGIFRGTTATEQTALAGGSTAHNNLQPYIVTLFIQKI